MRVIGNLFLWSLLAAPRPRPVPDHLVVLPTHGVPDLAQAWVTTPPALVEDYFKYLPDSHYRAVALRDVGRCLPAQARETPH